MIYIIYLFISVEENIYHIYIKLNKIFFFSSSSTINKNEKD